jgi:hypothetical protein
MTLFHTASDKLPASLPVALLRWWIPAILCLIGVVLLIADGFRHLRRVRVRGLRRCG